MKLSFNDVQYDTEELTINLSRHPKMTSRELYNTTFTAWATSDDLTVHMFPFGVTHLTDGVDRIDLKDGWTLTKSTEQKVDMTQVYILINKN